MRFALALLFAGAASAHIYLRADVPTCALTCISDASTGSCSSTDSACLCADSDFVSSVTSCIESECSSDDISAAEAFAQSTCEAAGVTLTDSATASGSSASATSASGSGSSSASSSASTSSSSSGASPLQIPGVAAFALGLAAFAL